MYKLIVCDVDGTLLDHSFDFNQADKTAIAMAQEKGVKIALCSGRSHKSLKDFAKSLGINAQNNYIIGFNGGLIYDMQTEKVVLETTLDKQAAIEIVRCYLNTRREIEIAIYMDGENLLFEKGSKYLRKYQETSKADVAETTDILAATKNLPSLSKILFIGENHDLKAFEDELYLAGIKNASIFFTAHYLLQAGPETSSKGSGLKWLCDKLGFSTSQTIAIGDNYNDLSMIEAAGLGVAVSNAVSAAKDIANYITQNSCTTGAVAETINKFVLSKS